MTLNKEGVSRLDNDNEYIEFIGAAAKLADPMSFINFQRTEGKLHVTIIPNQSEFKQDLIDTVLEAHRRLQLRIHFSSSLKISKSIYYYLDI